MVDLLDLDIEFELCNEIIFYGNFHVLIETKFDVFGRFELELLTKYTFKFGGNVNLCFSLFVFFLSFRECGW